LEEIGTMMRANSKRFNKLNEQMNKYYRTIIQVEVLSDKPLSEEMTLGEIDYQITEGECSGRVTTVSCDEVSPKEMAELLISQGSDPQFLY